ncbi:MAG: class I SAM-dependent methyltransferase [Mycobacterium sp.]
MEVVRSDDDTWGITGGVGYTALVVAGWRALHTAGPHPIARDEYARGFVTASEDQYLTGLLADPPTAADAAVFPRLYGVQTRFFDEFFGAATRAGIRQAVIVAAGLDCRAYRLPWPVGTTLFELDQPGVLDFKDRVLTGCAAPPNCRRRTVPADLRDDWTALLLTAGFDRTEPTVWSTEGLLPYLRGPAQDALFTRIGALSAPGSRLAVGAVGTGSDWEHLVALERAHPGLRASGQVDFSALTYDRAGRAEPAVWLAAHGWAVDGPRTSPQLQAGYGRTPPAVDVAVDRVLHSEYLTATRLSINDGR